jgi:KUP system potassium uptake protein
VNAKRATSHRSGIGPSRGGERHKGGPFFLVLTALGVVFGDIGTSPLYTLPITLGAAPAFEDFILPLTLAILIGLFMMQRRGTASIGRLFGPVMVGWFLVIGVLGVINIWAAPEILKAVSPDAAARFVFANPLIAFAVMGGVFLALTGAEALYADMGHVGPTAIRRAWFGLVLPALLLNYFGQGALVLTDPKAIDSPFYKLAPHWALIPLVGLAALATIIASQALISGVFSLTRQAMQLGLCPRMRIVPTSSEEAGQI